MAFKLRSGNTTPFKMMGSSPFMKDEKTEKPKKEKTEKPKTEKTSKPPKIETSKGDPGFTYDKSSGRKVVIPSEASGEGDVILAQKKKMVDGKYSDDKIKREKVIQKNWDEKNPVEGRNQKGDIQRRDAQEEGHFDEDAKGNLGTLPGGGGGITDAQLNRIRSGTGTFSPTTRSGEFKGKKTGHEITEALTGRQTVKGLTNPETTAEGNKQYWEKNKEGKNFTKRVQKEADNLGWDGAGNVTSNPITLNRKVDKVKLKKKGYVRKTGEGFLGLQNRKKYIDGIEVTKDMPETAYQEQKRKKKEAKKQAKEERKAKNKKIRQKGSKYSGMSASQAQAAKLRDDEAAGLVPKGSYESVYGKS